MTDKLIEQLRDEDSYYRVQEKHWCIDAEELERQRLAAADRIEALTAENERLREALVAEREENLWSAYTTGDVIGDEWTHLFMSDGEWLAKECGFDPRQGYYSAAAIRNAIPIAARAALVDTQ